MMYFHVKYIFDLRQRMSKVLRWSLNDPCQIVNMVEVSDELLLSAGERS